MSCLSQDEKQSRTEWDLRSSLEEDKGSVKDRGAKEQGGSSQALPQVSWERTSAAGTDPGRALAFLSTFLSFSVLLESLKGN